jgi:type I restriction enzyme S subunit
MSSNGADKMAGEQNQQSRLVPELRFPEFRDAEGWEFRTLNQLLSEPKKRNRNLKYGPGDVLSVSGEYGCVNQIEFMGRSYAGVSVKDYHVVETGDVVYTKSPLKAAPFGIIKANKGRSGIVSTLYAVYCPTANARADYIDHYFSRNYNLNSYLQPIVKKGAKNDMKVKNSDVLTGSVWVPKIDEQKKIADCLSSIDVLIADETDKLEALKDHKKGLMQQLFSAPGETTPRLRFPEFRDAGKWEERALGEIASYQNGKAYEPHIVEEGRYIVVNARFISTDGVVKKWSNNPLLIAEKDDILMVLSDLPNGRALAKCYRVREDNKYAVNQRVVRLTPHAVRSEFLFPVLNRHAYLLGFNDGLNQTHLSKDNVLTCPILLPTHEEEQIAIADCLTSADALVAAQVDRLSALKVHKAGLMQQLFPVADEVQA